MDGPPDETDGPERTGDAPRRYWIVSGDDACEHPGGALSRLGSDGLTEYYRCGRCGAVIVSTRP